MNDLLPIRIQNARRELINSVNEIMEKNNLPCCIFSLVMETVLCNVKDAERKEILELSQKKEGDDDVSPDQPAISS